MRPRCAVLAAVFLTAAVSATAAEPDLSGNWLLSYTARGGSAEISFAIIKIAAKDGKTTATVIAPTDPRAFKVTQFKQSGKDITVALNIGPAFDGTIGDNPKEIRGGFGNDRIQFRAKLVRTDADQIANQVQPLAVPEPMTTANRLASKAAQLKFQARREKDAAKRKELTAQADEAQKEADEKAPALYREVIEKHADSPIVIDAAVDMLASAGKYKLKLEEATRLLKLVQKRAAAYGPKYAQFTVLAAAEALGRQAGLEPAARDVLKEMVAALTEKSAASAQARLLEAYRAVLERTGPAAELKAVTARLASIETKLDEEYLATVPPFKPTKFAGRKEAKANRVAVMELFTGAQCPPCVAADVAFDALGKSYKPTDLVLIQYHLHIPGPDPITNADTIARARYYGVNSTPNTFFNGKSAAAGGGGMGNAENKFRQYRDLIDPLLDQNTQVKVGGKASRAGDAVKVAVEVTGAKGDDDLRLRLLVVEESVRFVGGNGLRFHHHVVRAMPGGVDGVAIKGDAFQHTATADVAAIRKELVKYLDNYAANERPFPQSARPLDLKELKVIALVQNNTTKEIVQAAQIEIEGK